MNECIPEVVKATRACIKRTGESKLFSANITCVAKSLAAVAPVRGVPSEPIRMNTDADAAEAVAAATGILEREMVKHGVSTVQIKGIFQLWRTARGLGCS